MADAPIFNPEELAGYKLEVSADMLFNWANAIAGARGALQGLNASFQRKYGSVLDEVTVEEEHLAEVMKEIVEQMQKGMKI